jgi:photosystem II stability/assembly factor-like uncharacterized protein
MKKILHASVLAGSLALATTTPDAAAQAAAAPAALNAPALQSKRASLSAMLAMTHAGSRIVAVGERGIVLYSDDEGQSWTQAITPSSVTLTALRFVDDKRGWAVGHMGVVLHSEDGGRSWKKQLDGIQAAQLAYAQAQASGDEKALRQARFLQQDGPDKPFFDISIDKSGNGFVIGAYNLIFRTRDGGKTWEDWSSHLDNPKNLHLHAMVSSGDVLYIVGEQGLILHSNDAGQRFSRQPSPYAGSWFGALASARGLLLYGLRGKAYLLPTGSEQWQEINTGSTAAISSAIELSNTRLLLASQSGQLLREDSSGHFTPLDLRSSSPLTSVIESRSQQIIAASLRGFSLSTKPN